MDFSLLAWRRPPTSSTYSWARPSGISYLNKQDKTVAESIDPNRLKLTGDTGREGVLVGFRCLDCDVTVFGPATFCQACTSVNLEATEMAQKGTLYSFTIVRVPPAGWPGPVPYILGQVELPEGPHVLAEVIDCQQDQLEIEMPVELVLQSVSMGEPDVEKVVYKWRPTGGGS
jgi:uncharacterized OB-fold protein